MKITVQNYQQSTKSIDFKKLSEAAQDAHKSFSDFADFYNEDKDIKDMLDHHFKEVESYLNLTKKPSVSKAQKSSKNKRQKPKAKRIEKVNEEIRFIKRFVLLNGKEKSKKQILLFVNALQKAITEKRIRKTSKYAKEIGAIQEQLVSLYNRMDEVAIMEIDDRSMNALYAIAYSENVMVEIAIIKQYIGLNGKDDIKPKAERLLKKLETSYQKGLITNQSQYHKQLQAIKASLKAYLSKQAKSIKIQTAQLRGLQGIVSSGAIKKKVETKRGFTPNDILAMSFDMLGLTGKWKRLFGDVPSLFYFMIWGGAGSGKSTLAIELAYYLAEQLDQKVCYVAEEQKISYSLQSIIRRLGLKGDKLIFEPNIASDYSDFDVVFIDSITTLGLTGKDLEKLIRSFPNTSFVFLLQSTKGSKNFRGGNDILHLLDTNVVVERQDMEHSIARIDDKNRFGGQGELELRFG